MTDTLDRLKTALFGRYTIEREIGSGGMATVYLAEDLKHHRKVAIKVMRAELAAVLGGDRFLREIEIEAQLQHPNILTLIDSGEAAGLLYYVMPYVEGESLRDKLNRSERFDVPGVVRLLRDVADALAHAHQQGIVHRDIKPDNVLVSGGHRAIVMDFGVAKAVSEVTGHHGITTAGIALGTPAYMAPEQALADPNIDHRVDIYALGILAYELLTGQPPFTGPSSQAVLSAHLTENPEPITTRREGIPEALAKVVMRCLEKSPDDRWQSAEMVLERLEAMATPSGGTASARLPAVGRSRRLTGIEVSSTWVKRVAVLGTIVVIGLAAVIWWQNRRAAARELIAALRPAVEAGRLDDVYELLQEAGVTLEDARLAEVAASTSGTIHVVTEPPGAVVHLTRVHPIDAFASREPIAAGRTPIEGYQVVAGEYLVTLTLDGVYDLRFLVKAGVGEEESVARTLVTADGEDDDMVFVNNGNVVSGRDTIAVAAFLIDRHEVTNADFLEFVGAGGYRNKSLWPDTLVIEGSTTPWESALRTFTDRTGVAGPRSWSGGRFPEGQERHPVTGISWYEASAFARWQGKQLPTLSQWYRAALGDNAGVFPWGNDVATTDVRANFTFVGVEPVGSYLLGVSPYGCLDMAGNVREWLADAAENDDRRPLAGGSWQDDAYMFERSHVERFDPWFTTERLGFRLAMSITNQ